MEQESCVVFDLIDIMYTSEEGCNSSILQNYLKGKFRESSKVEYSGRFIVEKIVDLQGSYAFEIVREYNLLMVVFERGVKFLDLDSYNVVSSLDFGKSLSTVHLERKRSELNVILKASVNILVKYDLRKILDEKLTNEFLHTALIWEKQTTCSFIWGLQSLGNQLFVVDYNDNIHIFDLNSGDHIMGILPDVFCLVDIKFLPNGDLIACGNEFVGLLRKDENGDWKVHKSVRSRICGIEFDRCFSIFYQEKSEKIYVSDADGFILVFTKDLELILKRILGELSENYCLAINEKNGRMMISNVGKNQLLVLN